MSKFLQFTLNKEFLLNKGLYSLKCGIFNFYTLLKDISEI